MSPSAPSRCRSRRRRQLGPKLPNSQMNFEAVALYGASRARGLKPVGNQAREASKRRWLEPARLRPLADEASGASARDPAHRRTSE
ncbi:MAG: hypothetical protein C4334_06180 [Pyrinomonas sp.]